MLVQKLFVSGLVNTSCQSKNCRMYHTFGVEASRMRYSHHSLHVTLNMSYVSLRTNKKRSYVNLWSGQSFWRKSVIRSAKSALC